MIKFPASIELSLLKSILEYKNQWSYTNFYNPGIYPVSFTTTFSVFKEVQALYVHTYIIKDFYEGEAAHLFIHAFSFNHHLLLHWVIMKLARHARKLGTRCHFFLCSSMTSCSSAFDTSPLLTEQDSEDSCLLHGFEATQNILALPV